MLVLQLSMRTGPEDLHWTKVEQLKLSAVAVYSKHMDQDTLRRGKN